MISLSFKDERQTKTRSALLALFLLWGSVFLLSGCVDDPDAQTGGFTATRISGSTMGTTYNITLVSDTSVDAVAVKQRVDQLLIEVNQSMSTYIADSELMRLNGQAAGQWIQLSAPLYEVLTISRDIAALSSGAFDVTVGPLVDLWGFGSGSNGLDQVPDSLALEDIRGQFGHQLIQYDDDKGRVYREKQVHIDLSAIAKGYGVDLVSQHLSKQGFANHLVEIGGELRLSGVSQRGTPWRIAVESPLAGLSQRAQRALSLTDVGMATSGDYRNYFEVEGQRYSHTIDPRTSRPITHTLASVTVLAESAAQADGLATAFNVLGAEEALKLANREAIAAFFIVKTAGGYDEIASNAFKPYLEP